MVCAGEQEKTAARQAAGEPLGDASASVLVARRQERFAAEYCELGAFGRADAGVKAGEQRIEVIVSNLLDVGPIPLRPGRRRIAQAAG